MTAKPRCAVPGCRRVARFRVMLYRFSCDQGCELILMLDPDCHILCIPCAREDEQHYRETGAHLWTRQRTANATVILRRIVGVPWYEGEDAWEESEEHF